MDEFHVMHVGRGKMSIGVGTLNGGRVYFTIASFNPKDAGTYSRKNAFRIIEGRFTKQRMASLVPVMLEENYDNDYRTFTYTGDDFKGDVFDPLIENLKETVFAAKYNGMSGSIRLSYDRVRDTIEKTLEGIAQDLVTSSLVDRF